MTSRIQKAKKVFDAGVRAYRRITGRDTGTDVIEGGKMIIDVVRLYLKWKRRVQWWERRLALERAWRQRLAEQVAAAGGEVEAVTGAVAQSVQEDNTGGQADDHSSNKALPVALALFVIVLFEMHSHFRGRSR